MSFSERCEMTSVRIPQSKPTKGCLIGIPTLGAINHKFMMNLLTQGHPISFTIGYMVVVGRPVAEARNMIVERALKDNMSWVFFRDDDVLAPPETLHRLYGLMRTGQAKIVGGNYYSKTIPPVPLIMSQRWDAGLEDWVMGELLDVDAIGMGCTLIDTDVFRALEPPWFETKTPERVAPDGMFSCTEDVYFCQKAREAGFKIYLDTGIQCTHVDLWTGTEYRYDPEFRCGVWITPEGNKCAFPPIGHPLRERADAQTESERRPNERLYVGRGEPPEGYIKPDKPLRPFYRYAAEVLDDGATWDMWYQHAVGHIVECCRVLKPGGKLTLTVRKALCPDAFQNGQLYEIALFDGSPKSYWTEHTLRAVLEQLGMEIERFTESDQTFTVCAHRRAHPLTRGES